MMVRPAIFAATVVLAGLMLVSASFAQSPQSPTPKRESLAERIQRLRQAEADAERGAAPRNSALVESEQKGSLQTVVTRPIEQKSPSPSAHERQTFSPSISEPELALPIELEPAPRAPSRRSLEPEPSRRQNKPLQRMPNQAAAPRSSGLLQERLSELREMLGSRPAPRPAAPRPTFDVMEVEPPPATRPVVVEPALSGKPITPSPLRESMPPVTSSRRTAHALRDARLASQPQARSQGHDAQDESILLTVEGPQLQARTLGPSRLVVGRPAEFTVMISNEGDATAEDVVVNVQLPPGVDVEGTNPSRGDAQLLDAAQSKQAAQNKQTDQSEQTVHWRIDRLSASDSETVLLRLIPRTSKPFELQVRYTYAQSSSKVQVQVEEPMLKMAISGPSETVYGQTKVFILTVSNPGTGDAENVMLRLLPLDEASGVTDSHLLGTLRHGETKTVPVELTAGRAGTLRVRAEAAAEGGLRAEASKEVLVRRAELDVAADGPQTIYAGNPARYRVRVSNLGNAVAERLTITASLPPQAEFTSASDNGSFDLDTHQVHWQLATLQPGDAVTLQLECVPTSDGKNRLRVTATDRTDLTADAVAHTHVIARADLKLSVSDPAGPVRLSEEGVYEIRIKNRGTKTAEEVETVVFFSEGIEPVSVQGETYQIGQGQILFQPIAQIAPGEEVVLKIRAQASLDGNHTFRAEVTCEKLGSRLVAQETTHYYREDFARTAMQPAKRQPVELQPVEEPAELDPSEDRYSSEDRYPTPAEPAPIDPLR